MFEKFSVIDLIKTRSASVCTFAGNVVKFNVQTAQERPSYRHGWQTASTSARSGTGCTLGSGAPVRSAH